MGDETFIIAALMAMRHPKSIVLSGALSALYVMTVSCSLILVSIIQMAYILRNKFNWKKILYNLAINEKG